MLSSIEIMPCHCFIRSICPWTASFLGSEHAPLQLPHLLSDPVATWVCYAFRCRSINASCLYLGIQSRWTHAHSGSWDVAAWKPQHPSGQSIWCFGSLLLKLLTGIESFRPLRWLLWCSLMSFCCLTTRFAVQEQGKARTSRYPLTMQTPRPTRSLPCWSILPVLRDTFMVADRKHPLLCIFTAWFGTSKGVGHLKALDWPVGCCIHSICDKSSGKNRDRSQWLSTLIVQCNDCSSASVSHCRQLFGHPEEWWIGPRVWRIRRSRIPVPETFHFCVGPKTSRRRRPSK